MLVPTWIRFIGGAAFVCTCYEIIKYIGSVRTNALYNKDLLFYSISGLIVAIIVAGFFSTLLDFRSISHFLIFLLIFILLSVGLPLVFLIVFKTYLRPGLIVYRPYLVRYWPSWIMRNRIMVKGQATKLKFGLVESHFDIKMVLFSNGKTDNAEAKRQRRTMAQNDSDVWPQLIRSRNIVYPLPKYEEGAMTETGSFLLEYPSIKIQCEAPDFDPERQEILSDIDSLTKSPAIFPLVPRGTGQRSIVFRLIDQEGFTRGNITVNCVVVASRNRFAELTGRITPKVIIGVGLLLSILLIIEKIMQLVQ